MSVRLNEFWVFFIADSFYNVNYGSSIIASKNRQIISVFPEKLYFKIFGILAF